MISKRSVLAASWPRRTNQGRSWPPIAPALVGLLLITGWLLVSPSAAKEENRSLAEVADYLRDGDFRLVRPAPSDSTVERQHSEACGADLERAYKVLTTEKDSKLLIDAANVVALCTTNNPKNRAKLTTSKGVPEALVAMVKSGDPASIAAAGECIWISSFNSPENFQALTKAGAVDALATVLTSDKPCTDNCHHAKMWSAAALQNLAATYCTGDPHGSPYCEYEWVTGDETAGDGVDFPYKVVMTKTSKPKVDPTPVRKQLLGNEKLIEVLSKGICQHLESIEDHPEERIWPSRAELPDNTVNATIVPWAYMGLAKNLALDVGPYDKFSEQMVDCICDYAVQSPDWLEYGKAQDTLWNLGLDFEGFCEPLYHDDECDDEHDFADDDGNGCEVYEEERWCAEFGDIENSDGVTPDEACCACGGGNDMAEEL